MPLKPQPDDTLSADALPLAAFAFLAEDERRLDGLLGIAGLAPDQAKAALMAGDAAFHAHIVEFLLSDEHWARDFAGVHNLSPERLHQLAQSAGFQPLMSGSI